jgi:hypothetical protein
MKRMAVLPCAGDGCSVLVMLSPCRHVVVPVKTWGKFSVQTEKPDEL